MLQLGDTVIHLVMTVKLIWKTKTKAAINNKRFCFVFWGDHLMQCIRKNTGFKK